MELLTILLKRKFWLIIYKAHYIWHSYYINYKYQGDFKKAKYCNALMNWSFLLEFFENFLDCGNLNRSVFTADVADSMIMRDVISTRGDREIQKKAFKQQIYNDVVTSKRKS